MVHGKCSINVRAKLLLMKRVKKFQDKMSSKILLILRTQHARLLRVLSGLREEACFPRPLCH